MGTLYVVATPIGNLEDLSPRAARVLREVGVVVAEDTRVTRKLLGHAGSKARVMSYHAHSNERALGRVLAALEGGDVALVSDAGSPGVSDPGAELVGRAAAAGHDVVGLPGPSAVTAAIALSGFSGDRFTFAGFLPRRAAEREAELAAARDREETTVCFEAPHRVVETLRQMAGLLGERPIAVCRELSKLHEETFRGTAGEAAVYFEEPRGEFVIVISGAVARESGPTVEEVAGAMTRLRREGLAGRRLVDAVVDETGAARRRVYEMEVGSREG